MQLMLAVAEYAPQDVDVQVVFVILLSKSSRLVDSLITWYSINYCISAYPSFYRILVNCIMVPVNESKLSDEEYRMHMCLCR